MNAFEIRHHSTHCGVKNQQFFIQSCFCSISGVVSSLKPLKASKCKGPQTVLTGGSSTSPKRSFICFPGHKRPERKPTIHPENPDCSKAARSNELFFNRCKSTPCFHYHAGHASSCPPCVLARRLDGIGGFAEEVQPGLPKKKGTTVASRQNSRPPHPQGFVFVTFPMG